jgi:uncharacterized SAM-binding protein YcdF (DUF218 family)
MSPGLDRVSTLDGGGQKAMSRDPAPRATWDALIILGSNIKRDGDGYRPVTYDDHDKFGMLAGEIRIIAAVILYEQSVTGVFVFSTGISEKTKEILGPNVPSEATVYSQDFLSRIRSSNRPPPAVILEDRSVNTYSNLTECIAIIRRNRWKHVAIMSARYHMARVQMLWELAREKHPVATTAVFVAAEDVVTEYLPGIYEAMIDAAYSSPQGLRRLRNEAQGVQDLRDGKYVLTEFRLAHADSRGHSLEESSRPSG